MAEAAEVVADIVDTDFNEAACLLCKAALSFLNYTIIKTPKKMKNTYILGMMLAVPLMMDAQSAIDGFRFSQPDMKGTARFMGMGGAFGALGGDLTSLSVNPAGIGVYRRNEVGVTVDLDLQSATSESQGYKNTQTQTKFLLNNIGGVIAWNMPSTVMPNFNVGFTYNRGASFNAHYAGAIPKLSNSLSNYIAGIANSEGITVGDVYTPDNGTFDPYNPNDGGYAAPWLSILGYDSYLISPTGDTDNPHWVGQWGSNTSGSGAFNVVTTGGVNEYNIVLGGNFLNKIYWGMDFGVIDMNYHIYAGWRENLENAIVADGNNLVNGTADWTLSNYYNASGSGFNYKLGFIFKPIQELRIGFSFATPTWYSINESYLAGTNYQYAEGNTTLETGGASTNQGDYGVNSYNFHTPWKLTGSIAGVIGGRLILSADYEWQAYNHMKFYDGSDYYDDYYPDWGWDNIVYAPAQAPKKALPSLIEDNWYATNQDIRDYYQSTNTIRVGAEYRITPRFSARAGYAYVSSPVRSEAKGDDMMIYTSGTMPNYRMDNTTQYITCGLGYNFDNFYVDAAFVHKHMGSEYHAYTPDPANPQIPSPTSKLSLNNNQIVLSAGFKF